MALILCLLLIVCCNIIVVKSGKINGVSKDILDNLFFYEMFDTDPFTADSGSSKKQRWIKSSQYLHQPIVVKPPKLPASGYENDNGISLSKGMEHYSIVAPFKEVLNVKGKSLVVQYEVILEETLACGGAYVKLPRADASDLSLFNDDTPYSIMFGPDKCGSNANKVHFILQHENPISHQWEEKHFTDTPVVKMDKKIHLYTLELSNNDDSFSIYIDMKLAKTGNLLKNMKPSISPEAMIDDVNDIKPADWVEEGKIEDMDAVKPDDWNEEEPKMILNPLAVKPANWYEDEEAKIPDPNASKPDAWDDSEDGVWTAPMITNPKCTTGSCGKWIQSTMKNPKYKGPWRRPKKLNPLYKGVWMPRKVPNPFYFEVETPINVSSMSGIAVEVWTTTPGIFFDNFIVAHSINDAFRFANETFSIKRNIEVNRIKNDFDSKRKRKNRDKDDKTVNSNRGNNTGDDYYNSIFEVIKSKYYIYIDVVRTYPLPLVAVVLSVTLLYLLFERLHINDSTGRKRKISRKIE